MSSEQKEESRVLIQCDQCGTKYRVKQSRLAGHSSSVKCTRCKHVFKPLVAEEIPAEHENQTSSLLSVPSEADKAYLESTSLGDEVLSKKKKSVKEDKKYQFFMRPGELSSKLSEESENEFEDGESTLFTDHIEKEKPVPPEVSSGDELSMSELPESLSHLNVENDQQEGWKEGLGHSTHALQDREGSLSVISPTARASLPIVNEDGLEDTTPWGKLTVLLLVILFIFLGAIGGGVYFRLVDTSILSQLVGNYQHQFEFTGPLEGQRVKNLPSRQTFFVANGGIQNQFPDADQVGHIRLKGLAFDENRKIVESTVVYAGNVLTNEELSTWSLSKIRDYYKYNNGRNNTNFKLKENQEVAFQVVFFNSESILESISAKIVSYVRRNKNIFVKVPEN